MGEGASSGVLYGWFWEMGGIELSHRRICDLLVPERSKELRKNYFRGEKELGSLLKVCCPT